MTTEFWSAVRRCYAFVDMPCWRLVATLGTRGVVGPRELGVQPPSVEEPCTSGRHRAVQPSAAPDQATPSSPFIHIRDAMVALSAPRAALGAARRGPGHPHHRPS